VGELVFGVWDDKVYSGETAEQGASIAQVAALEPFEPGHKVRAVMGWDGVFQFDEELDLVDMARAYMEVVQQHSCGKCVPCRMGTRVARTRWRGSPTGAARKTTWTRSARSGNWCRPARCASSGIPR